MLQLAGWQERASTTRTQNAKPTTANGRDKRKCDERRARAKDYAAALGDSLGWDDEGVGKALKRLDGHPVLAAEDGLVIVELVLQAFARKRKKRPKAGGNK